MAKFEDALTALSPFRLELQSRTFADIERPPQVVERAIPAEAQRLSAFSPGGGSHAYATPLTNVHATGVGLRVRKGKLVPGEFVIKVYVFQKVELGTATPEIMQKFGHVEVDVEALPVQLASARSPARARQVRARQVQAAPPPAIRNQGRFRPIVGGVSISPLNARYVGTLGCFVKGVSAGAEQIFALSNNHVLADVNSLPIGTMIVQPGPEAGPTTPKDVFATLSNFLPVRFASTRFERLVNFFDAAIAQVNDTDLIQRSSILDIGNYNPTLDAPLPGMQVTKSGRTTGVTIGTITAIHVNSVQINYGTNANPRLAIFDDTVQIVGQEGQPFSLPGDSGSAILNKANGRPVALLFAGDGRSTTACDMGGLCRQFQVVPV